MYRLMILCLASSAIIVKPWCWMMESPGKRWSVGNLIKVREWWISERVGCVVESHCLLWCVIVRQGVLWCVVVCLSEFGCVEVCHVVLWCVIVCCSALWCLIWCVDCCSVL